MIGTTFNRGNARPISWSSSKIEFSPRPTAINLRGSRRASCRHSSLPIEPPAPVTITTRS